MPHVSEEGGFRLLSRRHAGGLDIRLSIMADVVGYPRVAVQVLQK